MTAESTQIKYNSEKANSRKYSKTKLPWYSRLLRHSARNGNEVGFFYNAPEPTRERGGGADLVFLYALLARKGMVYPVHTLYFLPDSIWRC